MTLELIAFQDALITQNVSRRFVAAETAEILRKDLFEVANTLFDVRGSIRVITTDTLKDTEEGYLAGIGPIPKGDRETLAKVGNLREVSDQWDRSLGKVADSMEWLAGAIKALKTAGNVPRIPLRTTPLAQGITPKDFASALKQGAKILEGNIADAKKVVGRVQAEVSQAGTWLAPGTRAAQAAEELLKWVGPWEANTKALASGFKDLAKRLES